jgi:hypothetical protein
LTAECFCGFSYPLHPFNPITEGFLYLFAGQKGGNMVYLKYLAGILVLGSMTVKQGTNLSNTPGCSSCFYGTGRAVTTDANNRVHVIWADEVDTVSGDKSFSYSYGKFRIEPQSTRVPRSKAGIFGLYYRRSLDGGITWEDTVRLADSIAMDGTPVASNNLDAIHVLWPRPESGVYYKRSTNGGTNWLSETLLYTGDDVSVTSVATLSETGVHATLIEELNTDTFQLIHTYSTNNGSQWETPVVVTKACGVSWNTVTILPWPSMAVSGNSVYLVWEDSKDDTSGEIYYMRSTNGGQSWQARVRLTTDGLRSICPTVAAAGNHVYVTWLDCEPQDSIYRCQFRHSANGGTTWGSTNCLIEDRIQIIDYAFGTPQVSARDNLAIVVWGTTSTQGESGVYFRRSIDNGTTWSSPVCIRSGFTRSANPSATIDDSGYAHVVWSDEAEGNFETFYSRHSLWGVEESSNGQLATGKGQLSAYPNPFIHNTVVEFGVRGSEFVDVETRHVMSLQIHDISGRLVRSFDLTNHQSPFNQITWDGRDSAGNEVAPGTYFAVLRADDTSATHRCLKMTKF